MKKKKKKKGLGDAVRTTSKCPECGHLLDAAFAIGSDARPRPNDLSVCIQCGEILCFNADLTLRRSTVQERSELPPQALTAVAFIAMRGRLKAKP
jgi:hypothetical protein